MPEMQGVQRIVAFTDRAVVPPHVLIRHMDGESVLLNLDSEIYFGLDTMGTRMWHLVTNSPNIEAAHGILAEEFEIEPELLRHDLMTLMGQLVHHGLVKMLPADEESLPAV
ncbi:MAG TPA: PqqD family protein [Candidatus Limnocylindrales bacterium]|nr:PqqD family protein [Candidatus Limnocylindrales bacterium]